MTLCTLSENTWMWIVGILFTIIIFLSGMFTNQFINASEIRINKENITANTVEIKHIKETLLRFEIMQKEQSNKMDIINDNVTTIKTIVETIK